MRQDIQVFLFLFSIVLKAQPAQKEKKIKEGMERKKIELALFSDDITVCTDSKKDL